MTVSRSAFAVVLSMFAFIVTVPSIVSAADFEFQDGDKVVLLGSTFIERAQRYGYLEAELTAALAGQGKQVTFRNLGWSGDTVWAESRGIFDPPAEGYKRMIDQVKGLEPTVILFYYGANEAYAGEAGLEAFLKQYEKLLDDLQPTGARYVLISPLDHLVFSERHPDPAEYNDKAQLYRDAIEDLAAKRNAGFVDLTGPLGSKAPLGSPEAPIATPGEYLTDTGVHLNAFGYKVIAQVIRHQLVGPEKTKNITLNAAGEAQELKLPRTLLPGAFVPSVTMTVKGLAQGRYKLMANGDEVLSLSDEQWAGGIPLYPIDYQHFDRLRAAIVKKNELYFHRWRPQNVTYLFLFRKHEQGQNAKEIPQFDPLVDEQEQLIRELSQPATYKVLLQPAN
ncbi:MAG: SGNH/GDSL hydrolase family protein [Planctomycetaceae bacterium]|nr:SGNH/GDSL hydrolase family protein [Planctomycetaceae bacterium]